MFIKHSKKQSSLRSILSFFFYQNLDHFLVNRVPLKTIFLMQWFIVFKFKKKSTSLKCYVEANGEWANVSCLCIPTFFSKNIFQFQSAENSFFVWIQNLISIFIYTGLALDKHYNIRFIILNWHKYNIIIPTYKTINLIFIVINTIR